MVTSAGDNQQSEPIEVEAVIDLDLEAEILLIGEPVEEVLDQPRDVVIGEEGDLLQLELSAVPRHLPQHERVDDIDDVADRLTLHFRVLYLFGVRGIVLGLVVLLVVRVLVDGAGQHHEEGEEDVEVVGLVETLVDFSEKLAEDVGTGLLV